MKPNHPPLADEQAVVDSLRRLPTPEVPAGLEARLIAGIPRPVAGKLPWKPWQVLAGLTAVAAAAGLAAVLLEQGPAVKDGGAGPFSRKVAGGLSALSLDPKETDPCNVLPPLGDWR